MHLYTVHCYNVVRVKLGVDFVFCGLSCTFALRLGFRGGSILQFIDFHCVIRLVGYRLVGHCVGATLLQYASLRLVVLTYCVVIAGTLCVVMPFLHVVLGQPDRVLVVGFCFDDSLRSTVISYIIFILLQWAYSFVALVVLGAFSCDAFSCCIRVLQMQAIIFVFLKVNVFTFKVVRCECRVFILGLCGGDAGALFRVSCTITLGTVLEVLSYYNVTLWILFNFLRILAFVGFGEYSMTLALVGNLGLNFIFVSYLHDLFGGYNLRLIAVYGVNTCGVLSLGVLVRGCSTVVKCLRLVAVVACRNYFKLLWVWLCFRTWDAMLWFGRCVDCLFVLTKFNRFTICYVVGDFCATGCFHYMTGGCCVIYYEWCYGLNCILVFINGCLGRFIISLMFEEFILLLAGLKGLLLTTFMMGLFLRAETADRRGGIADWALGLAVTCVQMLCSLLFGVHLLVLGLLIVLLDL
eukprot:gene2750-1735_t